MDTASDGIWYVHVVCQTRFTQFVSRGLENLNVRLIACLGDCLLAGWLARIACLGKRKHCDRVSKGSVKAELRWKAINESLAGKIWNSKWLFQISAGLSISLSPNKLDNRMMIPRAGRSNRIASQKLDPCWQAVPQRPLPAVDT